MEKVSKLLQLKLGLLIIGLSTIISFIFGWLSSSKINTLTSYFFAINQPIMIGLVNLVLFLIIRFISKEFAFMVMILLSLINIYFNFLGYFVTLN